jgi:hypothetical protein
VGKFTLKILGVSILLTISVSYVTAQTLVPGLHAVSTVSNVNFSSTSAPFTTSPSNDSSNCDYSSYPDFCIPPPPPSLNCDDVNGTDFTVFPPDPHGFDRDKDGEGCETSE